MRSRKALCTRKSKALPMQKGARRSVKRIQKMLCSPAASSEEKARLLEELYRDIEIKANESK